MNGLKKIKPSITKISFPKKDFIKLNLLDGREIFIPLKYFPDISKLDSTQRKKWYVLDEQMFSFEDCIEIFHIEQILGKENIYQYSFSKKPLKTSFNFTKYN